MNDSINTALDVLASNPALRNAMIKLQEDNARLRAERDASRAASRAWKRKAYQWRNEAANALGLWPNVGWRVSELRRWYREFIR